ncbi:YitT family protein [Companilactobacillus halodurans]|uniref:YitT family protein n=1 Tax=Companilactobacillus halodurans TaxID=2584183 RepID=A0A5P0ZNG5_9LACO|nr:YitT family protein [Companilactobacillus halodurans]MQS75381.1 YitT family protein [Companilactobacillus halodurans]MQS97326.1 YitT family protein [Companilactobacillus halodurans]
MKFVKDYYKSILAAIFYGVTSALGIQLLLQPAKLYTSGVTGAAQLIVNLLNQFSDISTPVYLWYALLNLPLIVLAWFRLGKKFTILSIISVVSASIFILIIPLYPLTKDPVLSSVFGGILSGAGIGLCFRYGFSTGGTDIIALIIQRNTGRSVGQVSFAINAVIIVIAGFAFGWELALYTIISIYITNTVVDKIYIQQQKITVTVYSHKIDEISKELLKTLNRGLTLDYHLQGAYSGEEIGSITMVLTKYQLFFAKKIILNIDPMSFINIQPTMSIAGKFSDS